MLCRFARREQHPGRRQYDGGVGHHPSAVARPRRGTLVVVSGALRPSAMPEATCRVRARLERFRRDAHPGPTGAARARSPPAATARRLEVSGGPQSGQCLVAAIVSPARDVAVSVWRRPRGKAFISRKPLLVHTHARACALLLEFLKQSWRVGRSGGCRRGFGDNGKACRVERPMSKKKGASLEAPFLPEAGQSVRDNDG